MIWKNFFLLSFIFCNFAIAQQPAPTPTPKPAKKTNQRPTEAPKGEPFDTADVKKMAEQCAKLETEVGNIELEFFPETSPETVRNFLNLIALKFFDTTLFTRVVPNFVVQGGNFGSRLDKPYDLYERSRRNIKDEPSLVKHERGIISMARGDEPDSASTHFFILVRDASFLDGKFAAFGRVTSGMEIVDNINKMPVVEEKPEKPVRLLKATIVACPVKTEQ